MFKLKSIEQLNAPIDIFKTLAENLDNFGIAHLKTACPKTLKEKEYLFLDPIEITNYQDLSANEIQNLQDTVFLDLAKIKSDFDFPIALVSFAYEAFHFLENIPKKPGRLNQIPDLLLIKYSKIIELGAEPLVFNLSWGKPNLSTTKIFHTKNQIQSSSIIQTSSLQELEQICINSKSEYLDKVNLTKDLISSGDIYQINFSQRFQLNKTVDPVKYYRNLLNLNPGKYSCFISLSNTWIVSSSPELFLDYSDNYLMTAPIKGTRKRSTNQQFDLELRDQLISAVKDNAELAMIVDLERNDLGKIAEIGSVQVLDRASIQSIKQIHHLVALVAAKVNNKTLIDILLAMYPTGSITGAPKIAAMKIIAELENYNRDIYTGSIGYLASNTNFKLNVAIRTAVINKQQIHFSAGSGIVADSDPELEYQECLLKAQAMFQASFNSD